MLIIQLLTYFPEIVNCGYDEDKYDEEEESWSLWWTSTEEPLERVKVGKNFMIAEYPMIYQKNGFLPVILHGCLLLSYMDNLQRLKSLSYDMREVKPGNKMLEEWSLPPSFPDKQVIKDERGLKLENPIQI